MARKRVGVLSYTKGKILKRLEQGTTRPEFMSHVLRHNDEKGMSTAEIQETFTLLILAGLETTATLLAGRTFLSQTHSAIRRRLEEEIRNSFGTDQEITMLEVARLKYLHAVVMESLRLYPPVAVAVNRVTPLEGASVCGYWVPGRVSVTPSDYRIRPRLDLVLGLIVMQVTIDIPQFVAYTSPLLPLQG